MKFNKKKNVRKIKVALCDLANDMNGIDNKSIPIGVGYKDQ